MLSRKILFMVFPVVTFTHKLGNVQIESFKFIQFSLFEKTVTWHRYG